MLIPGKAEGYYYDILMPEKVGEYYNDMLIPGKAGGYCDEMRYLVWLVDIIMIW